MASSCATLDIRNFSSERCCTAQGVGVGGVTIPGGVPELRGVALRDVGSGGGADGWAR